MFSSKPDQYTRLPPPGAGAARVFAVAYALSELPKPPACNSNNRFIHSNIYVLPSVRLARYYYRNRSEGQKSMRAAKKIIGHRRPCTPVTSEESAARLVQEAIGYEAVRYRAGAADAEINSGPSGLCLRLRLHICTAESNDYTDSENSITREKLDNLQVLYFGTTICPGFLQIITVIRDCFGVRNETEGVSRARPGSKAGTSLGSTAVSAVGDEGTPTCHVYVGKATGGQLVLNNI
ncbi:hypothetical protein EVAR_77540_1 [Eumeta japonica]|uniref:Uncharacterized protein n=1 Tax=Eumeta variegata TaxID=151549 RepID=A0A4C1T6S8_EUMVA|nr:hypothetical protein EVAR_77540_1 [Eumeta japonica]